ARTNPLPSTGTGPTSHGTLEATELYTFQPSAISKMESRFASNRKSNAPPSPTHPRQFVRRRKPAWTPLLISGGGHRRVALVGPALLVESTPQKLLAFPDRLRHDDSSEPQEK